MKNLTLEFFDLNDAAQWNRTIEALPGAHALQTWQWADVKSKFGWEPFPLVWRDSNGTVFAAALVLRRRITQTAFAARLSVMYSPRGPLLDWSDTKLAEQVLKELQSFAQKRGAIFIKVDPDLPLGWGVPGEDSAKSFPVGLRIKDMLETLGWVFSDEQIQFRNTVELDLRPDEGSLLMQMKSKTRYNIRLAEKKGVTVRPGGTGDIDLLYRMYAHTAERDNFLIRSKAYYQTVWKTFINAGLAEPLIAEVEGQSVGGVIIFRFGNRAWYFYGMSLDEHREKMFNYRLQFDAMCRAKAANCHTYDLWGAPDNFNEDDPLWGVYRFKDGFGGRVVRTLGAWDFPVHPYLYRLYSQVLPAILGWMRRQNKSKNFSINN